MSPLGSQIFFKELLHSGNGFLLGRSLGGHSDVLLLDFADNSWHITFAGAVKLANTYPKANIICIHWGSVDAPEWNTFNGDPARLAASVVNPERVHALYPGEAFTLKRN